MELHKTPNPALGEAREAACLSVCLSSCIHRSVTYCRSPVGGFMMTGRQRWDPLSDECIPLSGQQPFAISSQICTLFFSPPPPRPPVAQWQQSNSNDVFGFRRRISELFRRFSFLFPFFFLLFFFYKNEDIHGLTSYSEKHCRRMV